MQSRSHAGRDEEPCDQAGQRPARNDIQHPVLSKVNHCGSGQKCDDPAGHCRPTGSRNAKPEEQANGQGYASVKAGKGSHRVGIESRVLDPPAVKQNAPQPRVVHPRRNDRQGKKAEVRQVPADREPSKVLKETCSLPDCQRDTDDNRKGEPDEVKAGRQPVQNVAFGTAGLKPTAGGHPQDRGLSYREAPPCEQFVAGGSKGHVANKDQSVPRPKQEGNRGNPQPPQEWTRARRQRGAQSQDSGSPCHVSIHSGEQAPPHSRPVGVVIGGRSQYSLFGSHPEHLKDRDRYEDGRVVPPQVREREPDEGDRV